MTAFLKTHSGMVSSLCVCFFMWTCQDQDHSGRLDTEQKAPPQDETRSFPKQNNFEPSEAFKNYWLTGKAEIASYELEQARYGELHKGQAVLVYVTEPFLPDVQVKADQPALNNIPVFKLNATKNFNTGIYPYAIMQSTFYPINNMSHALKVSCSVQEWCGQAYTQLNNRAQFEVSSHSYFEHEADADMTLEKSILENELWIQLRLAPNSLPVGRIKVIPSLEFLRLKHIPLKAYTADAVMTEGNYSLNYPALKRTLSINFNPEFPYTINAWTASYPDGLGADSNILTTKATLLKTIQLDYWNKNKPDDIRFRDTLQLN